MSSGNSGNYGHVFDLNAPVPDVETASGRIHLGIVAGMFVWVSTLLVAAGAAPALQPVDAGAGLAAPQMYATTVALALIGLAGIVVFLLPLVGILLIFVKRAAVMSFYVTIFGIGVLLRFAEQFYALQFVTAMTILSTLIGLFLTVLMVFVIAQAIRAQIYLESSRVPEPQV